MKRGDAAVISVSAALAAVVVAGVVFSILVLDRRSAPSPVPDDSNSSLLVLTWGPSLCKTDAANPGCRSGHVERLGQSFLLHGLWPQPYTEQYCDVPRELSDRARKPVTLPGDLQTSLQDIMSDSELMTTHEWYAHGTCSGVTPPEYFGISASLAGEADRVLRPVFSQAAGQRLSARSVREAVDRAFGAGSGQRVTLSCKDGSGGGSLVYEVRMSLPPVMTLRSSANPPALRDALAKAPALPLGCSQGRVP